MDLDPRLRASQADRPPSDDEDGDASETPSPSRQLAASGAHGAHPDSPTAQDSHAHDPAGDANDPKRSRACEACRGLKVRCEPDPNDEGPCKRCKKAGRNCVVTAPTRKRQKKTDSRVAELEKKIDALTASLQSRGAPAHGAPALPHGASPPVPGTGTASSSPATGRHSAAEEPSGYGMVFGGGATRHWSMGTPPTGNHGTVPSTQPPPPPPRDQTPAFQPPMVIAGQKRKAVERSDTMEDERRQNSPAMASTPSVFKSHEGDIVDRGVMSMEKAAEMFARYNDHMMPHLPAVVFPPSMTVSELRKTKPILFLAIMAAAVSEHHALQRVLQKELMQVFAEKIFMTGEKTLELVQALSIAVMWYWPPEHFEELKFYQLVHIAAVMAIDIGLGKKNNRRAPPMTWKEHPFRRTLPPDPTSIESRRAWLACHFMSANTAMALHRPNLIRWTPFMAECVDILESSPDASPTDKYFCHLVWTHHQAEEVGVQFSMDDPANAVNLADIRTQYALKAFERDMEKYKASIPKDYMQPSLQLSFNVVSLYMHEMALHPENITEQLRPPFMTESIKDGIVNSEALSSAHINALSACLAAVEGIFETFLGLDVTSTRCLPVFNFVRVAYAVVILLRMYFSASSADSELGRVIRKEDMRVHYYLDALLEKFRATASDDKCRPAAKFLVVLAMFRSWFFKQESQPGAPGTDRPSPNDRNAHPQALRPQPQPPQANTPLHLLSEVAAGSKSSPSPLQGTTLFAQLSGVRQPPQPFFHHDTAAASSGDASTSGSTPGSSSNQHLANAAPPSSTAPMLPGQNAAGRSSVDIGAAMAPAFPPWVAQGMPADFFITSVANLGHVAGDGAGGNAAALDGLSPDTQNAFEGGARYVMNEPWFSDVFSGLPDPNLFPF